MSMGVLKVLDAQEETHPTSYLSPNDRCLFCSIGPCEQNSCLTSGRTHDDPSLWTSIVGHRWRVRYQLKPKLVYKELNSRVVVLDYERDQV
jgi:hypothetical protein